MACLTRQAVSKEPLATLACTRLKERNQISRPGRKMKLLFAKGKWPALGREGTNWLGSFESGIVCNLLYFSSPAATLWILSPAWRCFLDADGCNPRASWRKTRPRELTSGSSRLLQPRAGSSLCSLPTCCWLRCPLEGAAGRSHVSGLKGVDLFELRGRVGSAFCSAGYTLV